MPFEMTVGLWVADHGLYAQYRHEIGPLLQAAGGRFRYDFEVSRTLRGESGESINRLFVLQFTDVRAKERFFADERYREIRRRLFEKSVQGAVIISEHESPERTS